MAFFLLRWMLRWRHGWTNTSKSGSASIIFVFFPSSSLFSKICNS
ncbi:hypothetical protein SLEP1_g3751 [Rubroshorea leprosula]|uniref:Uncharacterized protein n=1 Tax=Rubroshorea leprosula TaxID=152421 RepID=A0AAV5HSY4_9ROSI|nr:hypothetical protein SLEP1_g3751 [Rubroshorea leprosula]